MAKITLTDITSGYKSITPINNNNADIEDALNNKVLYRNNPSGEANQMENTLDMNSNRIINLPDALNNQEPVTYRQAIGFLSGAAYEGTLIERQTATAEQTVFTLVSTTYLPGSNNLSIYINGIRQDGFNETSSSVVTFNEGLLEGDDVVFVINEKSNSGSSTNSSNVTITVNGKFTNTSEYLNNKEVESVATLQTNMSAKRYSPNDIIFVNGVAGKVYQDTTGGEAEHEDLTVTQTGTTTVSGNLYWTAVAPKEYSSILEFAQSSGNIGLCRVLSREAGWTDGPKNSTYWAQTGSTNTSPSRGTAVAVSTIGGRGTGQTGQRDQTGLLWDADGKEYKLSVDDGITVKPEYFWNDGEVPLNWIWDIFAFFNSTDPIVIELTGRYPENQTSGSGYHWDRSNVTLRGVGGAVYPNSDCSSLEGGAVIEGRTSIGISHNFTIEGDVGFDNGKTVVDVNYPSAVTTSSHPQGGGWDGFSIGKSSVAAAGRATNFNVKGKITGLAYNSTASGHAVLIEAVLGGKCNHAVGIYAIHGVVFKTEDFIIGTAEGYANATNGVIIKSDPYGPVRNLAVDTTKADRYYPLASGSMHTAPNIPSNGLFIQAATESASKISVGKVISNGSIQPFIYEALAGYSLADVQIGQIHADGDGSQASANVIAVKGQGAGTSERISIGHLNARNTKVVVSISSLTTDDVHIGSIHSVNNSLWAIKTEDATRLVIDTLYLDTCSGAKYYLEDTSLIAVGEARWINSGSTIFQGYTPVLDNSWSVVSGGKPFEFRLENYKVAVYGTLENGTGPVISGSGTIIPYYLRPLAYPARRLIVGQDSSGDWLGYGITCNAGLIALHGAAGGLTTPSDFIDLAGASWDHFSNT